MNGAAGPIVSVKQLPHALGLPLPVYQSAEAAGADLVAALPLDAPILLAPGARCLVPTGLAFQLERGYEAQVRPRSGLAFNHGITVLNAPGTIDSDYRGEVSVLLINCGAAPFEISRGLRIAQIVIAPVSRALFVTAMDLADSDRGTGGFGSTGMASRGKEPQ